MTLEEIKRILEKAIKHAQIGDQDILTFLLNNAGSPICYLFESGQFVLTSKNCVVDTSKISGKLLIGEEFIEKMQRAQVDFTTDYNGLQQWTQMLRDIALKEAMSQSNARIGTVVEQLLKLNLISNSDVAKTKKELVRIFEELRGLQSKQVNKKELETIGEFICSHINKKGLKHFL